MSQSALVSARLIASLLLLVSMMASPASRAADLELRLATINPPQMGYGIPAQRFARHVHELSGGKVEISVFYSGVLGNLQQLLGQLRAGVLDLAVVEINTISILDGAETFRVFSAPYLFDRQEDLRYYLGSEHFRQLMAHAEDQTRLKYIGYAGDRSPRALTTRNRPVASPKDLKGLKIRVPLEPVMAAVWRDWGASPTPVKASDMYMALQTGMVDGQENGIITVAEAGLFTVQKYFSPVDYMRSGIAIYMSGTVWQGLSNTERAWLQEAASRVDQDSRKEYPANLERALALARSTDTTIVEVDLPAFKQAAREIIGRFDGARWPKGLYQDIRNEWAKGRQE